MKIFFYKDLDPGQSITNNHPGVSGPESRRDIISNAQRQRQSNNARRQPKPTTPDAKIALKKKSQQRQHRPFDQYSEDHPYLSLTDQ